MNRRTFISYAAATTGLTFDGLRDAPAGASIPAAFLLSDVGCSRATGYEETNKIVTLNGKTHVAWLDSPREGFRVRIRTLDHASGIWEPTVTVGEAHDNHGGPALTVDSQGYLHIVYFPHHHPMRYRKSVRPNDASEWGEEETFGSTTTYPTLVCAPDDTLIVTCRESSKSAPWLCNRYIKRPGKVWEGPHPIMQALTGGYAHFMEALAWGHEGKTLHLSCRLYDGSPGHGHTIGYMRSADYGETWTRLDGNALALPVTAHTIDVVSKEPTVANGDLRGGSIITDSHGLPLVLCSHYGTRTAWLSYPDGHGGWANTAFTPPLPEPEGWGLVTPGGIAFSGNGELHAVLTLVGKPAGPEDSLWGHPSSEIAHFVSQDNGRSFVGSVITEVDAAVPRWLPNLERPTGHNRTESAPHFMFTEGVRGGTNTELVQNRVYFV
ncbi:MAG: hypothetical protein AMXMBFR84_15610 [Candidatus Hydrogenedentota bacterium]